MFQVEALPWQEQNFLYDFTIEVQDGSGREVELTELGKLRRRNAEMYISREHFQLAPRKVLENTVEISELFKMTKPDRYSHSSDWFRS